jgi:hypothetical protein
LDPNPPDPLEIGHDAIPEGLDLALGPIRLQYPARAREAGVRGTVIVRILVDRDGTLVPRDDAGCKSEQPDSAGLDENGMWHPRVCIRADGGHPDLWWAALSAWSDMRFRPLLRDGVSTRAWMRVPVNFDLAK